MRRGLGTCLALALCAAVPLRAVAAEPRFALLAAGGKAEDLKAGRTRPCLLGAHAAGQPVLLLSLRESKATAARTGAAASSTAGGRCTLLEGAPRATGWDVLAVVGAGPRPYRLASTAPVQAESLADLGRLVERQRVVQEAIAGWRGGGLRSVADLDRRPASASTFPTLRASPTFVRLRLRSDPRGRSGPIVAVEHGNARTVFGPCATDLRAFTLDGDEYVYSVAGGCSGGSAVRSVHQLDGGLLQLVWKSGAAGR